MRKGLMQIGPWGPTVHFFRPDRGPICPEPAPARPHSRTKFLNLRSCFQETFRKWKGLFFLLIDVWLISREELVQFWNPAQCSAKQYTELEGVDENGPIMQRFLNQQKGFLETEDENEEEDESYEDIEGDENEEWEINEED